MVWPRGSHTIPTFIGKLASTPPGWDTLAETIRNLSNPSPQKRDLPSGKSPARDRRRAIKRKRPGLLPERIESQLLRLARRAGGVSRGDGGFRLAVRLYLHGLCETIGRGIRLESRIGLAWLRDRCSDGRVVLASDRPLDRSIRPSPHYSSLHDGVRLRSCFAGVAGFQAVAVLSDLLGYRRGR